MLKFSILQKEMKFIFEHLQILSFVMATSESIQISGVQEVTVPVDAPPPYPAHTPAEPPPYQANAPPGHTSGKND